MVLRRDKVHVTRKQGRQLKAVCRMGAEEEDEDS